MKPAWFGVILLLSIICGTQGKAKKYLDSGAHKFQVGPEYYTGAGKTKRVVYRECHNASAINITAPLKLKRHLRRWDTRLNVEVMGIFVWGFTIRVFYVGEQLEKSSIIPRQLELQWRAEFASQSDLYSPCPNAWLCKNRINGPQCSCYHDYWGERCQKRRKYCNHSPCLPVSRCEELADGFKCHCGQGYSGMICEHIQLNGSFGIENPDELLVASKSMVNVTFDRCFASPALKLSAALLEKPSYNVTVLNFTTYGFVAEIARRGGDNASHTGGNRTITWSGVFDARTVHAQLCNWNGICSNTFERHVCNCEAKYTGERCETDLGHCYPNPCQEGATCINQKYGFKCTCDVGFGDPYCPTYTATGSTTVVFHKAYRRHSDNFWRRNVNRIFDRCFKHSPSRMEGTVRGLGNYPNDFSVEFVEFSQHYYRAKIRRLRGRKHGPPRMVMVVDWVAWFRNPESFGNDCYNNATCLNRRDHHKCICKPGFTGENCSIELLTCVSGPCKNGGTCQDEPDGGHLCICASGYQGELCDDVTIEKFANETGQVLEVGSYPVGANDAFCRVEKLLDVVYERCYAVKASRVEATAHGSPAWPDTFSVQALAIHSWGFRASVRRSDYASGWGQTEVELEWKAVFDSTIRNRSVCLNGGECHNHKNGQRCQCYSGFGGTHCETRRESREKITRHL